MRLKIKLSIFLLCSIVASRASAILTPTTARFSVLGPNMDGVKILKPLAEKTGLAKLGVKPGDILLESDFKQINSIEASSAALSALEVRSAIILREGKSLLLGKWTK